MNTGFGDNIRVEAVAKIDGVDVIAAGQESAKARSGLSCGLRQSGLGKEGAGKRGGHHCDG